MTQKCRSTSCIFQSEFFLISDKDHWGTHYISFNFAMVNDNLATLQCWKNKQTCDSIIQIVLVTYRKGLAEPHPFQMKPYSWGRIHDLLTNVVSFHFIVVSCLCGIPKKHKRCACHIIRLDWFIVSCHCYLWVWGGKKITGRKPTNDKTPWKCVLIKNSSAVTKCSIFWGDDRKWTFRPRQTSPEVLFSDATL